MSTAGFENRKLCSTVNVEISEWVFHRIHMTGLAGEIKQVVC